MAPNDGTNPFERFFRPFFGSEDGSNSANLDDIFANFPERAKLPNDSSSRFPSPMPRYQSAFQWSSSSSYQVHQDQDQVSIEIDVPGVPASDLKVEVVQNALQSCIVQWSGQRGSRWGGRGEKTTTSDGNDVADQYQQSLSTLSNRIRLGPHVDCDKLSAHLSHGVLQLKAPLKEQEDVSASRSIPITED